MQQCNVLTHKLKLQHWNLPLHIIETAQLIIAPCDAGASVEIARIVNYPEVFAPYYIARATHLERAHLREEWSSTSGEWDKFGCVNFAVVERATGELLGNVQFAGHNLGYFLKPSSWGRGYGSEMVKACCETIPQSLGLRFLTASTIRENVASRRILEKSGFTFTGLDQQTGYLGHGHFAILHYRLELSRTRTP